MKTIPFSTSILGDLSMVYKINFTQIIICSRGLTDKASDFGSGDCGFESHRG